MFSIRVELHNATWSDYIKLAEGLRAYGIVDTVLGNDGIRYKLPPAEYHYDGNRALAQVQESARMAGASTGRQHAVVSHEVSRMLWAGLQRA
jgi:hypothetical protein